MDINTEQYYEEISEIACEVMNDIQEVLEDKDKILLPCECLIYDSLGNKIKSIYYDVDVDDILFENDNAPDNYLREERIDIIMELADFLNSI